MKLPILSRPLDPMTFIAVMVVSTFCYGFVRELIPAEAMVNVALIIVAFFFQKRNGTPPADPSKPPAPPQGGQP